ncbi:MAG TPA: glycosyltransferase [Elusimicrobiota bacterium]|nr:glycosyltransferase [Elusimicrobiota bacterium]
MRRLVFVGAHLGYPMDKTPLGGGAMVGLNLARAWAARGGLAVTALGAGALSPAAGVDYVRLGGAASAGAPDLVRFSEMEYARFCRAFEGETTRWLLDRAARFPADSTAVVVNDISEAPDLDALARAGYRPVSLWHVDVADYFCRMYLGGMVSTPAAVGIYERLAALGAGKIVPDVLRLVFDKQRKTVRRSARLIFPSRAMAEVVRRAYAGFFRSGAAFAEKARVVPWGSWDHPEKPDEAATAAAVAALRARYQITEQSLVLMTLSRLSPEKGVHLLLEALALSERRGDFAGKDVCLFICGAPAFMRGEAYARRVRRAARRLRQVRVFFPGYLGPDDKRAFFSLAKLFISPSVHESYGLNAMEAMRAGLPVLALEHYGSRDWPQEGFARAVSPEKSGGAAQALARGLREMIFDPRGLSSLGRAAAAFAAERPFSAAAQTVADEAFSALDDARPAPILK